MTSPIPPPRPRQPSIRREEEDSDPRSAPGISDVVRLLANESLERSQRDRRVLDACERISNAVEAIAAIQRMPPMRPEATSQNDVMIEALRITAEATGRHATIPSSSTPPFLRDWRGPIRLTRKLAIGILLGACAAAGTFGFGYAVRDCGASLKR